MDLSTADALLFCACAILFLHSEQHQEDAQGEHESENPSSQLGDNEKDQKKLLERSKREASVFYVGGISLICTSQDIVGFLKDRCPVLQCRMIPSRRRRTQAAKAMCFFFYVSRHFFYTKPMRAREKKQNVQRKKNVLAQCSSPPNRQMTHQTHCVERGHSSSSSFFL